MGRIIKKWIRNLLIVAGILIAIPLLIYITIQIPAVQTMIVRKITNSLSEKLQSDISVGKVDYRFFNKLALSQVLVIDMNRDTLLYTEKLSAGIRKIDRKKGKISLGRINLTRPEFNLVTDSAGNLNLKWYLEHIKSSAKDSSGQAVNITIDRIDIDNGRFSFLNRNAGKKKDVRINSAPKIDFSDLALGPIDGTVENFNVFGDTVSFSVFDLGFREKSGFSVSKMNSDVILTGGSITLESTLINCDTSILNIEKLSLEPDSTSGFRNFIGDVRIDALFDKSVISTSDLRYFAPVPEAMTESVSLSGKFSGTVAELRGRDVSISYREKTFLDCNFDISGLPEIGNAFIYIGFNEFKTNATDLARISLPNGKKINIPEFLYKLGDISFDGSFSGFTTDFVTYGEFSTARGDISTDVSLRPENKNLYRMKGFISGHNIDLKALSGSDVPGNLNMHANIDGYANSTKKFAGNITGLVDSIEINGYNYRNIDLKGQFTEKTWDGSINIAEENIKLDLLGMFNFNDTLPEFDFTLNVDKADLYRLNIDKKDSTSSLSILLTSNFKGNSIDNLDGDIKLLNSDIIRNGRKLELYDFTIRTFTESNQPVLSLRSDFVDATVKGNYNFEGLKHFFRMTVSNLMPSLLEPEKESREINHNDFNFEIVFKNTDGINDFFNTGLLLAEKSFIKGSVAPDTLMRLEGKADYMSFKNIRFNDLDLTAGTKGNVLNASVQTSSLLLPGQTDLKNFGIDISTVPDTFFLRTSWDNQEQILNQGLITAMGSVWKSPGQKNPVLKVNIDSSRVYANDRLWQISEASVLVDSSSVTINDVNVGSAGKFYRSGGTISENASDTLHLQFKGIDISPLNHLGKKDESKDTTKLKMDLKGQLNGDVAITGVYGNLLLESDIILNAFSILGSDYGDIFINSDFDNNRKVVDINASNNLNGSRMFDVSGYYDPEEHAFNVGFITDRLPVGALNPLLKSFASNISGSASGRLRLTGSPDRLTLNGSVKANNVKLKINYLQTSYTINDSIRFDNKGIRFNNVRFSDEEGRTATITGAVNHTSFKNYTADLTINMNNNFLVLNTVPRNNPSFYGKVYASGVTRIKTSSDLLSFDISARTGNNTKFYIPLTNELSMAEYSFVTFRNPDSEKDSKHEKIIKPAVSRQLGIDLNIDLTVTPEAVAELIFDEKVGDKITGSGTGLLNINLNPKGDLKITGDYTIERGTYLFTLGNIVNKRFDVENGGKISFNGALENAEIELKAIYQKFSTSLYPVTLDPNDKDARYAVEPQLLLSGRLFNPTVKFEIFLPNADEQIRTRLRNVIASDEVLSRQFMYLLVTNTFYNEQASASANAGSNPGTSAISATTFEMISNQLSNWISQINENLNLGLNYRPGTELDPNEVQLAFETQVFNDRIVLNGNFDYRTTGSTGSTSNTGTITGDFEADLKITDKLRFKVFNRFNETYYGTAIKGPYTQGIGIFYREDFEKLSDLFKRKEKQNAKKEE